MKKHAAVCLLFTFLACLSWGRFIQAQSDDDYKAEITANIIDPCFQYSASKSEPLDGISESEMVELMKLMSPDAVQDTIDVTLPAVKGQPPEARMRVYELGLKLCIRGTGK